MSCKYFTSSHVRDDPLIFACYAVKRPKAKMISTKGTTVLEKALPLEATEHKGELLICVLWKNGTKSVHNMHVVNTDAKYHSSKTTEKCLKEAERAKKKIYLEACLN